MGHVGAGQSGVSSSSSNDNDIYFCIRIRKCKQADQKVNTIHTVGSTVPLFVFYSSRPRTSSAATKC